MHFGLCTAPEIVERLLETVLIVLTSESCFGYLDDVTVIGRPVQKYLDDLQKLFQNSPEAHLKLVPDNRNFSEESMVTG
jgi:hypothetical protein